MHRDAAGCLDWVSDYRPDIDGLRSIAVVLVLLYHAGLSVPGGFIGVDVFFVISGYLITRLICRQQAEGSFTLRRFYARRIRRILPASILVSFVSLVAGSILLFPGDSQRLAGSTLAHQGMLANFYFCSNTGYFQAAAETMPLLHTWSLAVEEQFYLLYPFLLVAIASLRVPAKAIVLGIAASVSLAYSEFTVVEKPSAAFYLLPSRAWELLLGGLCSFFPASVVRNKSVSLILSIAGLSLIVISAMAFDENTRFPGVAAIAPCLGAVLVILSNSGERNLIGHALSLRPVVYVGLISYSLYLWHWPILAFARYWFGSALDRQVAAICLATSFLLAGVSYRFVETTFRKPKDSEQSRIYLLRIVAAVCMLIAMSLYVIRSEGFPSRVTPEVKDFLTASSSMAYIHEVSVEQVQSNELPAFGDPEGNVTCLVWGDSHAMSLMPGIASSAIKNEVKGYQATHSSTAPVVDFAAHHSRFGLNEEAPIFNQAVLDCIDKNKIDVVILAAAWRSYAQYDLFESRLRKTFDELTRRQAQVVVVLDVASHDRHVPLMLSQRAFLRLPTSGLGTMVRELEAKNRHCNEIIERVATDRATVLDPSSRFVDQEGVWRTIIDGEVMWRDSQHLTVEGGMRLESLFDEVFTSQ